MSAARWAGPGLLAIALIPAASRAQQTQEALAKQLQNPVASLISVPLQSNLEFGLGPDDAFRYQLNVQPVVPLSLNQHWNVISRTILPILYQEELAPGLGSAFGTGDLTQSFFFSPKNPVPFIWGVGPAFLVPTATDDLLGADKWGVGPTVVLLKQHGPYTYGLLANHIWSFAGDETRPDVSATFLQPFASHTSSNGFTASGQTEATYDWEGDDWTIPLIAGVSKVFTLKARPVSLGASFKYYLETPDAGPDWGIRLIATLLFPK